MDFADVHTTADLAVVLRTLRRREARGRGGRELTYRELAAKTGWSFSIIGEYLSGRRLPPTERFDTLVRLLGATPAEQGNLATVRDRVDDRRITTGAKHWPVPRQLPPDLATFCGRADQLDALDALLETGDETVVITALAGTAGVGKTALAVRWAHRVSDRFPDGQLYVNLQGFGPAEPMRPGEALGGFLGALGVQPSLVPGTDPDRTALYRSLLAGKRVLVVLDNARTADHVRPLLPGSPGCLAVVTSRHQLTGLSVTDGARPFNVDLMSMADATELIATRIGPDRAATDPESVRRIVDSCARLPLALSIAAARAASLPRLPLRHLAGELDRVRLDALTAGDPLTDLRAAFTWSYEALDANAARVFRLLGRHPGADASIAAVSALADLTEPETRRGVAALVAASMLTQPDPDRVTMHDLLRSYAREMAAGSEGESALDRVLGHYVHTAHAAALLLAPRREVHLDLPAPGRAWPLTDHSAALAWLATEYLVLVAAIELAASAGRATQAWWLAWALADFVDRQGYWQDFVRIERIALDAVRQTGDLAACAYSLRVLGLALLRLGETGEAHSHMREALAAHVALGDHIGQARVHLNLGGMCEMRQSYTEALHHCREALALFRRGDHMPGAARALNATAWCHVRLGDHADAIDHCSQALALLDELGDLQAQAGTHDTLGYAYHQLGRFDDAADSFTRAIELFRDMGDRYYEADALTHLGDTRQAAGSPETARESWHEALGILEELGHPDADGVRQRLTQGPDPH